MENMDKGLTVPKWVLIVWPKILQNWGFNEKRLHWASVVCATKLWTDILDLTSLEMLAIGPTDRLHAQATLEQTNKHGQIFRI